jgi:glycine amidinotransferase
MGLLAGMIAFATVLGALLIAQRRGLLVPALRLATRWRALRFLALLERPLEQIDAEMARVHAESTGRVVLSAANYAPFGGSFHCATLDIRRRGELQSYF